MVVNLYMVVKMPNPHNLPEVHFCVEDSVGICNWGSRGYCEFLLWGPEVMLVEALAILASEMV